tara:strand:- start:3000 stop:3182 length:183 start_codon:yes stop_codon:yes gene_type:complete
LRGESPSFLEKNMKLTQKRKKELDSHGALHHYYFRNIYTEEEWQYITRSGKFNKKFRRNE